MGIYDQSRRAPRGVAKLVLTTKRIAVSVFRWNRADSLGSGLGGVAVEDALEERTPPPAATGVRLTRAWTPPPPSSIPVAGPVRAAGLVALPPPKRRAPWISSLLVFALAAVATFAAVYVNALRSGSGIALPQFLRAILPSPALGLRVEAQGDRLLVNWDRRSATVRSAVDGVLRIEDGGQSRALHLDASQVAAGAVLYKPASDDVTFRLEVRGEQGATVMESMRVLDSVRASPAREAGPKPESSSSPSSLALPSQKHSAPKPEPGNAVAPQAIETPNNRDNPNAEPANRPAASSAPIRQEPAYVPPVSTPPSASMMGNKPVFPPPIDEPEASEETPKQVATRQVRPDSPHAAPAEIPDGKSISMLQPARALRQVMPDTRAFGPGLVYAAARVEVLVTVDKTGHVKSAHLVNGGRKVKQGLAGAALVAARQWLFEPAMLHGQPIESQHSIMFEFRPSAP